MGLSCACIELQGDSIKEGFSCTRVRLNWAEFHMGSVFRGSS